MSRGSDNVFDSIALPLILQLEEHGFDLQVQAGALFIKPAERVTPELRAQVRQHKPAVITLVRICDDGVLERLGVFKRQLTDASEGSIPAFVFQRGVPYTKGICFSCGAPFPELRYGRCWRCSWAWRMAVGVSIPALLGTADDTARVCA